MFFRWVTAGVVVAIGLIVIPCMADQPRLGFKGTLVAVPDQEPLMGYRVEDAPRDSIAAKTGLRRGDIVYVIGETYAFTTHEAYLYALRQQGKKTKLGVLRGDKTDILWLECPLGHDAEPHADEDIPEGVVAVDFASDTRDDL